ncbi:MAG TPA: hypothetical protein VFW84_11720 [Aquabacterium sp.]|uniref:hypothetical protein n=1 Tax=Aquabacterium sp. TaxID=1872578 RepID=UPI002E3785B8|nr:hypothetical protein [Aquabacterium sp.]HEX5373389.1 hypothetical protein [Aquabacterium sp.]
MEQITLPTSCLTAPHADAWAGLLFHQMLEGRLTPEAFEQQVQTCWAGPSIVFQAPETARRLRTLGLQPGRPAAGYASDAPHLDFRSHWLAGTPGRPGAIHIQSPPEAQPGKGLTHLNRPVHQHDSARIALITRGQATFHVQRSGNNGCSSLQAIPVQEGDLLVWPAWTAHTFDAGQGFWLVTAMARYVSPAADGFLFPVDADPMP